MSGIGTVYRVRNWDHHEGNLVLKYGLGRERKKVVAVMVFIGEEPLDGSAPIDLDEQMKRLGWRRA